MPEFDKEKCRQRNRIAAARDGVESVPLAFGRVSIDLAASDVMGLINARRPEGSGHLSESDVYVHWAEAANSSFVGDRFCFLDATTLQNIAADAEAGIAFMNSHRTGGLSHPSELPMGRTFAGRYEETIRPDGSPDRRAIVGIYMLRGAHPNGESGPSTDDLHRLISAGTVFDVSVGLFGGETVCDVCANRVRSDECRHVPGTHRGMDETAVGAQLARGVKDGKASYTVVGARCGEVSAVFDGAVPGAGFRKALSLARARALSPDVTAEARHAYAALMGKGDFDMDAESIIDAIKDGFAGLAQKMGVNRADTTELHVGTIEPDPALVARAAEAERLATELEAEKAARLALERSARETSVNATIEALKREGRVTPAMETSARELLLSDQGETAEALLKASPVRVDLAERGFDMTESAPIAVHSLAEWNAADSDAKHAAIQAYQTAYNVESYQEAEKKLKASFKAS